MPTVQTTTDVGPDRVLRVAVPVDRPGRHRVTIQYEPADGGWPPGYLDQVIGGWQGEFPDVPEGVFETRDPL